MALSATQAIKKNRLKKFDHSVGLFHGCIRMIFLSLYGIGLLYCFAGVTYGQQISINNFVQINGSTPNGPMLIAGHFFGSSIANMGDLDGDGVADMAVGANNAPNGGSVFLLFLNSDGSVKSYISIDGSSTNGPNLSKDDGFGGAIANMGDLDGNGFVDLAVGAAGDSTAGFAKGAVYLLFLQENGTVKNTVKISGSTSNSIQLSNADSFGISVANIGDFNKDGVVDLAVGAIGNDQAEGNEGAVYLLFLETDGSLKSVSLINSSTTNLLDLGFGSRFGSAVANIGDVNNDGIAELAIGAEGTNDHSGSVFLFFFDENINLDSVKEINRTTENGPSLSIFDLFGHAIAPLSDFDGDGVVDLAVGAQGDDEGGSSAGAQNLIFLNEDGTVKNTIEINNATPNTPSLGMGNNFGTSIANMGEFEDSNTRVLAVGANAIGTVYLLFIELETLKMKTVLSSHSTPYPNPVQDSMHIAFDESTLATYTIYSLLGKRHSTHHASGQTHQLNVSSLAKGVYLLKAQHGNQTGVFRFVKE